MMLFRNLGIILVLIGSVVGLIFATVSLAMVPFMAGLLGYGYALVWQYGSTMVRYAMFGYPNFGLDVMDWVMCVWSLLGIAGALLSLYCGFKLRQRYVRRLAVIGIVGGILLLLTFSWFRHSRSWLVSL